jgi:hypothetical protein
MKQNTDKHFSPCEPRNFGFGDFQTDVSGKYLVAVLQVA